MDMTGGHRIAALRGAVRTDFPKTVSVKAGFAGDVKLIHVCAAQ